MQFRASWCSLLDVRVRHAQTYSACFVVRVHDDCRSRVDSSPLFGRCLLESQRGCSSSRLLVRSLQNHKPKPLNTPNAQFPQNKKCCCIHSQAWAILYWLVGFVLIPGPVAHFDASPPWLLRRSCDQSSHPALCTTKGFPDLLLTQPLFSQWFEEGPEEAPLNPKCATFGVQDGAGIHAKS